MKRRFNDVLRFLILVLAVIAVNMISSQFFGRYDATSEKRFSLHPATQELVENFEDRILVRVYLDGDFPSGFQRLSKETRQMLDEFRAYNSNIEYEFINPNGDDNPKVNQQLKNQLADYGLQPIQVEISKDGEKRLTEIFPGAVVFMGDVILPISLLQSQFATDPEVQVNSSIQNLEYQFANVFRQLQIKKKKTIGFLTGHGELEDKYLADIALRLSAYYSVSRFNLREFKDTADYSLSAQQRRINRFDAVIIAKPQTQFTDLDKLLIDQYIMSGGKVMWFVDPVYANMDSLQFSSEFIAYPIADQLNLTDQLFKYGVRFNPNLVQDMVAAGVNDRRSVNRWVYFPMIMPIERHPIVKDLNAIKLEFASTLDTITSPGIKKTVLLRTSPYTRVVPTPHRVSLNTLYEEPNQAYFQQKHVPVGILLEGKFDSYFANRIVPTSSLDPSYTLVEKGAETQMIVVADGDIIKNQLNLVNPNIPKGTPLPLGFDQFTGMEFGNKDFLLNAADYLLDDTGLINVRSRELKIRLLDNNKVQSGRVTWQIVNTVIPVVLIVLAGLIYGFIRRRRYTK